MKKRTILDFMISGRRINLKHLRAFRAVALHSHFTRAADAIGLGDASRHLSGAVLIATANGGAEGTSGSIRLATGDALSRPSGSVSLATGASTASRAGDMVISPGTSGSGAAADLSSHAVAPSTCDAREGAWCGGWFSEV